MRNRKPKPLADILTISRGALEKKVACNSRDIPPLTEHEGRRKRWVGIGFVDEGPADGTEVLVLDDKD